MRRTDPGLDAGRARSDRVAKAAASTRRVLAADAATPKPARRRSTALGPPTDLTRRRAAAGATAAAPGLHSPAPNPPGGAEDTLPLDGGELHRGVLTSGAADQLAALVARAAHAPAGLIHFMQGDRLRLYGGWGLSIPWDAVADIPLEGSLAGIVIDMDAPLVIGDTATDPRVPPGSPVRADDMPAAYLGHPIRDPHGAVLGICCAFDAEPREWSAEQVAAVAEAAEVSTLLITEQLSRHEIDQQHRFLDAVLDSLHDGVTACDADGRIVFVNERMRRLLAENGPGTNESDANGPGQNGTGAHGPDENGLGANRLGDATWDDAAWLDRLTDAAGNPIGREQLGLFRALRGEHLRDEEMVLRGRGRRTRHYLVDAHPIAGPGGRTAGAVQAVQDVTRRRRVERFRMCELAVTTALAEAPSIEAAGPRVLEAVVGTLGWAHAELWLVDDAAGVVRPVARWSAPGAAVGIDVPTDLPYGQGLPGRAWQVGKPLWIRDVGRPQSLISRATAESTHLHAALAVPVREGFETLGVLTAFADGVEDPEDELLALMAGIAAHIGQYLERTRVEDLQRQLNRSKNEYLALVGHELRTPLTSISAYTELLREADEKTLVNDGPRLLEVIERNTTQLRHIINELMELSALDTGHADVQLSPMDLAEVVRDSVARARAAIHGVPVEIDAELPDELVLPGDRKRLRQVVDNLLGNAVRYSPDGGRIVVTLRTAGRAAKLAVSDTGQDVPADEREKLFTGHYRTSRVGDRSIPGTGLGLTLSRAVVSRHYGGIELVEDGGRRTTVLVRLPMDAR